MSGDERASEGDTTEPVETGDRNSGEGTSDDGTSDDGTSGDGASYGNARAVGNEHPVTRRRALAALGVGAAFAGVGCAGLFGDEGTPPADDATPTPDEETPTPYPTPTATPKPNTVPPGTDTPTATETATEPKSATDSPTPAADPPLPYPDARHVGVTDVNPARVQFNPFNLSDQPLIAHHLLFEPFAKYSYADGEFRPAAVSEWERTGNVFELTLREGLDWTNGDPVTSRDVAVQLRLAEYVDDSLWERIDAVETPDDRTVRVRVAGDVNPGVLERELLADRFVQTDRATYGDILDQLDRGADVHQTLGEFDDSDPVTCGLFRIVDQNEQRLLTRRFDAHPDAANVNFGEYEFRVGASTQARQQALLGLGVDSDYSLRVPARLVAEFPDDVVEVRTPDVYGIGLTPNHDHPHAGDRAVRRAVAYAVDREAAVENSLPRLKEVPAVLTGIAPGAQERWLGETFDDFETYGSGSTDTAAARSVLEAAGYERVDGTWQDAEGETVSLPVTTPAGWSDWTMVCESVVRDLREFGFETDLQTTGNYFGVLTDGDFALVANTWLHGGPTTHPYYSLRHHLHEPQIQAAHSNYPPFDPEYGGSNAAVTVSAREGSGETTVRPGRRLDDLATATDPKPIREIVRELAWVANQDLPAIPVTQQRRQSWLTTDEWTVPEDLDDDPDATVQWAPTWLPRTEKLNYDPA